jgi:hypothetical protein
MKQTLSLIIYYKQNLVEYIKIASKFPAKNLQYYQVLSFALNLKKEKIFFQLFTQREFIKHLQKRYNCMEGWITVGKLDRFRTTFLPWRQYIVILFMYTKDARLRASLADFFIDP